MNLLQGPQAKWPHAGHADYLGGRGRHERRGIDQRGSRNGYELGRRADPRCSISAGATSGALSRGGLALHIGKFLGDFPVPHPEDVNAPHLSVRPCVPPELHDAVTGAEGLLFLEPGVAVVKDRTPGASNGFPTDVADTVWSRSGGVEDAIVSDKCQGCLEIVLCPGGSEALHDCEGVPFDVQGGYFA